MSKLNKISLITALFGGCFFWFSFNYLDQHIAYSLHKISHTSTLYIFFQILTHLGDSKVAAVFAACSILITITVLIKYPQNKLATDFLFIGLAMSFAMVIESILKFVLGRCRPELLFNQGLYGFHYFTQQFSMHSTPSGHATHIFVLVTAFSLIYKRFSILFILLGLLVAFSRLILEFHYLGDIIFGGLLGIITTLWIAKTYYSLLISSNVNHPLLNQTRYQ